MITFARSFMVTCFLLFAFFLQTEAGTTRLLTDLPTTPPPVGTTVPDQHRLWVHGDYTVLASGISKQPVRLAQNLTPIVVSELRKMMIMAWIMNEPVPISHGDAPKYKNAVVISVFHTLKVPMPRSKGKFYDTFESNGEYLEDFIVAPLRKIGYEVPNPIIDTDVTVEKLIEVFKKSWGVVYINSHGELLENGDYIIATGEMIPVPEKLKKREDRNTFIENYLEKRRASLPENFRPYVIPGWIGEVSNGQVPFISIRAGFFRQVGADFSSSLVFINGCESANRDYLRRAINPRSFVGWRHEIDERLAADALEPFWSCLTKTTRSDREAMDYTLNYLFDVKKYEQFMAQHPGVISEDGREVREAVYYDPRNLLVYRRNKDKSEDYLTMKQRSMLRVIRDYAARRRGGSAEHQDMPGLIETLRKCINKNDYPEGVCHDALNLGMTRVQDWEKRKDDLTQLDEVKGELCGYGGGVARFTLIEQ